jgi:hypothetical protein
MIKIKIKNLITGKEFGSTFKSMLEAEQWHNNLKELHGNENATPPTAQVTITDISSPIAIEKLWNEVNAWMDNQMDSNSRTSINLMLADSSISEARKNKILLFAAWWQSGWEYYGATKAALQQDPSIVWDCAANIGLCPVDIWDIAGTP